MSLSIFIFLVKFTYASNINVSMFGLTDFFLRFYLRFSEDILQDIQKGTDAMMEDIDIDIGIVAATVDVGKVPYFSLLDRISFTNCPQVYQFKTNPIKN